MATYKTPGVYVEEISKFPRSVVQTPTSIPVFIGYTGNTTDASGNDLRLSPVNIFSLTEFTQKFGNNSGDKYLFDAVLLFYANGGGECYIISTGAVDEPVSFSALAEGLGKSNDLPVQLIVIPDACLLPQLDFHNLQKQMLATCATLQDRFAILDTLKPTGNITQDMESYRGGIGNNDLKWGAAYYPWLKLASGKLVPPSGAIAGVYAMVDTTQGVWKAPANVSVSGVANVSAFIDNVEQGNMNISFDGKSVNALRVFPGKGVLVWGARTLDGNSMDWRYISVRRTLIMIESSIKLNASWVVFEPNDANTWVTLKAMIENYLTFLWKQGGLAGSKPEDAFGVNAGLGVTMTPQDILEGRLVANIFVAVTRPAEFIVITLQFKTKTA